MINYDLWLKTVSIVVIMLLSDKRYQLNFSSCMKNFVNNLEQRAPTLFIYAYKMTKPKIMAQWSMDETWMCSN